MVRVGDVIGVDHTLCMIEAMKLLTSLSLASFNRDNRPLYPPGTRYKVARIAAASGQVVNAGDLLFIVEPLER
jgi:biotin carboxyl carrier protein